MIMKRGKREKKELKRKEILWEERDY